MYVNYAYLLLFYIDSLPEFISLLNGLLEKKQIACYKMAISGDLQGDLMLRVCHQTRFYGQFLYGQLFWAPLS